MILDVNVVSLEPSEAWKPVEVGRGPEGRPIFMGRKVGEQGRAPDGRLMHTATVEREGFLLTDNRSDVVAQAVLVDRKTGRAYRPFSSGGTEIVNGVPVIDRSPLRMLVVEATDLEIKAARRGVLPQLTRLAFLRVRLYETYQALHGEGPSYESPAFGERAENLRGQRDKFEDEIQREKIARELLVRSLEGQS